MAGSQTTSAVSAVLSPTGSGFLNDYSNSGGITDGNQVTNLNKLAFDFVIGGSVNMAFTGAASWLSRNTYLPISDPLKTSRPIIPQVGFQYAPGMNGALPNSQTILISGVRYPYLTLQQSYLAGLANQIVDKGWDVANEFCSQSLLEKIYPIP